MANGEDLAFASQFYVPKKPCEWAYEWDCTECGTSSPTPREGYATFWLVANRSDNPVLDVQLFFNSICSSNTLKNKYRFVIRNDEKSESGQYGKILELIKRRSKTVVLHGTMNADRDGYDPYCGRYATIHSTTSEGYMLLLRISESCSWGLSALMTHNEAMLNNVAPNVHLKVVTGHGPDGLGDGGLTTRFALHSESSNGEEEVARCHLSYIDGSHDPSFGPSIEMIAVRQDHRGKGYLSLLWSLVRMYIEENFTIECLNNDAPLGHIAIKVTYLCGSEVELRKSKGKMVSISDKDFFYKYTGFSVRELKGVGAMLFASGRPADEEGILYLPLLTKKQIEDRINGGVVKGATLCKKMKKNNEGTKVCNFCRKFGGFGQDAESSSRLFQCSQCKMVYYCSKKCQKQDWRQHKQWCCETEEEVNAELVKQGKRIQNEDGEWTTVIDRRGGL